MKMFIIIAAAIAAIVVVICSIVRAVSAAQKDKAEAEREAAEEAERKAKKEAERKATEEAAAAILADATTTAGGRIMEIGCEIGKIPDSVRTLLLDLVPKGTCFIVLDGGQSELVSWTPAKSWELQYEFLSWSKAAMTALKKCGVWRSCSRKVFREVVAPLLDDMRKPCGAVVGCHQEDDLEAFYEKCPDWNGKRTPCEGCVATHPGQKVAFCRCPFKWGVGDWTNQEYPRRDWREMDRGALWPYYGPGIEEQDSWLRRHGRPRRW